MRPGSEDRWPGASLETVRNLMGVAHEHAIDRVCTAAWLTMRIAVEFGADLSLGVVRESGSYLRVHARFGKDRLHFLLLDRIKQRRGFRGRRLRFCGNAGNHGAHDLETKGGRKIRQRV